MSTLRTTITRSFTFEASHSLSGFVEDTHKCAGNHGHTYSVTVSVSQETEAVEGWVVDFGKIKEVVFGLFDHKNLNDVFARIFTSQGVTAPPTTVEALAELIWNLVESHVTQPANVDRRPTDWARIERVFAQEGQGGSAEIARSL